MIKRPYTTKLRPWKDSDDTVDIVWYPCLPGAPTLGFPSKINSLDWDAEPWEAEGVGEVWGEPRTFNRRKAIPAATGQHVCGTEQMFAEGEAYDPEGPVVEYRPDGLPTCCTDAPIRSAGGIGGMPAIVSYVGQPVGCEVYQYNGDLVGGWLYRTGPMSWEDNLGIGSVLTTDGAGNWSLELHPNPTDTWVYTMTGWDGEGSIVGWVATPPAPVQYMGVACF